MSVNAQNCKIMSSDGMVNSALYIACGIEKPSSISSFQKAAAQGPGQSYESTLDNKF